MYGGILVSSNNAASAAPEPLVLGVTRGFLDAARTKVGAAQGITNAAIQAGSDGVNLGLNSVQDVEAVKSNALRGAVNITRNLGTEVLTQTRNLANHLPSAVGIRGAANLGLNAAQGALDLGANVANGVFTGAQALVNGTLGAGRSVNSGVTGAAQGVVNVAGNVAGGVIGAKANAVGALQNATAAVRSSIRGAVSGAAGAASRLAGGLTGGLSGSFRLG
ncbi:hypothetical protein KUF71_004573 [Frankliniella fusca]|uniref:Uncharacterized protein n=1 Tax=Frankliniella fusca TaxID=407009 RepID=A0AAE1GZV6_9NEOP|nr:hypothetical protein KUF71_004573 [Frankliniella fusca]